MQSSILITSGGRDHHLQHVLTQLNTQSTKNFEVIVVLVNQKKVSFDISHIEYPLRLIPLHQSGKFNFSQARNTAAANASTSIYHFLDVDCLPAHDYVEKMSDAVVNNVSKVYTANIAYLNDQKPYDMSTLDQSIERTRTVKGSLDYGLVWTLSLSMHRDIFEQVGGFDEQYEGYSSEDTDFGMMMQTLQIPYHAVDTRVYHQRHGAYGVPYRHMADIVRNATYFKSKWGEYSCLSWLQQFEKEGYIRMDDERITILKLSN